MNADADGGSDEPDHDWHYCNDAGRAEMHRSHALAFELRHALARATPRGGLDVRAIIWNHAPAVCAELRVGDALALAGCFARFLGSVNGGGAGWVGVAVPVERHGGHVDQFDLAQLNPGWYAIQPGVRHVPGLRRAYTGAILLEKVLGELLPGGPLAVDPDTWEDGEGVVRLVLRPCDASRVTALLGYVLDHLGGQSRAR